MSYENNIANYSNSVLDAMQSDAAKRIAEGGNIGDEARQAAASILGPLGLDMLKEGIMAKAGVSSALKGQSGKDIRSQLEKSFNDRLTQVKASANAKIQDALSQGKTLAQSKLDAVQGAVQDRVGNASNAMDAARTVVGSTVSAPLQAARSQLNNAVPAERPTVASEPVVLSAGQLRDVQAEAKITKGYTSDADLQQLSQNPLDKPVLDGSRETNQSIIDRITARKQSELAPTQAKVAPAQAEVAPAQAKVAPAQAEVAPAQAETPQSKYDNVVNTFKAHVDEKVAGLQQSVDSGQKIVIAADKDGTQSNIGSNLAKGQFAKYTKDEGLAKDPSQEVQDYTNSKLEELRANNPEQVSYGRIKPVEDIPEGTIHVWGANSNNSDLPTGTPVAQGDGGQARVIGEGSPKEVGIVSTPLTGLPTTKASVVTTPAVTKLVPNEDGGGVRIGTTPPVVSEGGGGLSLGAQIAGRSGDALTAAAATVGIGYTLADKSLTSGQKAVQATEQAAPLVAEKAVGDIVPAVGLAVSGVEDIFTPNMGSTTQRLENFGEQAGILGASKVAYKAGAAVQRSLAGSGGKAAGEEGTDLAGEQGTELSTFGAEEGAEVGVEVGADAGIDAVAGGLAASGPETGGLGFIASGAVLLGATLASIFAPHHDDTPAPENYAVPVQGIGLR